jgi:hypothetical protein
MLPVHGFATPTANLDSARRAPGLAFLEVPEPREAQALGISSLPFAVAENIDFTADAMTEAEADAVALAAGLPADGTRLPDETPPCTKVPEPASLMLIGSGLLAVARASRMKRPCRTLSCATPIAMENAISRKALARQAA